MGRAVKRAPRPGAVLITGAAGFLGGALARHLATTKRTVTGLDVVATAMPELPSEVVDVRDAAAVRSAVQRSGAAVIVHAAAALPNCSAAHLHAVNVTGTRNVLEAARVCGVERVVFVSSSSVFPVRGHHDEDAERAGSGPYAASKAEAEDLCVASRRLGLPVAVLRVVPVVGPGRLGIFGLLFEWVREGRRIPMIGDGANHHQLIDIDDACSAIERLLDAPVDALARPFNAGAARTGTVREDITALCDHAGTGARPVATPAPVATAALAQLHRWGLSPIHHRVFESASVDATVSIARLTELGWRPRHSSAEALVRGYRWYLEHRHELDTQGLGHRYVWPSAALDALRRLF